MRYLLSLLILSLAFSPLAAQRTATVTLVAAPAYPATDRQELVEEQFGTRVADPYRWLENDVREDPKVRQWVTAQNNVTNAYLDTLPGRALFRERLQRLFDRERYDVPEKKGGRYFYTRNDGLQNQSVLYVRDSLAGTPRTLIDPNSWSKEGTVALAEWKPSDDGKRLLYAVQDGGTDWRVLKVIDVDRGSVLADEIKWVKFSDLAWATDGSGFYYSRFPEPKSGQQAQSLNHNQAVYFHRLGTPQSADRLVYSEPEQSARNHSAAVSDDGRWLIVTTSEGTDERYNVTLLDVRNPGSPPRRFITGLTNDWRFIANKGDIFYWVTNKDAPRLRIVATDINRPVAELRELVGQQSATLDGASLIGDRLVASYLVDARSEVRTFDLDGKPLVPVKLPGIGSAVGFHGRAGDPETFFSFASYNVPTAIYRYDSATGGVQPFAVPKLDLRSEDYLVEQQFYVSKDGTRVPIIIVQREDRRPGPAPALLHGYGGFNISKVPEFSEFYFAWVEQGGVLAVANLRGGGEYGKDWHDAGRLANKQNVFDDFIAAGEYLIAQGLTTKEQLAGYGRSNGGLLMGAVVNQRPDLFAAALPQVGVMDMLRFDRFTAGRNWVDDYGSPSKEAEFRTLYAYSPYHNIRGGRAYPAILATTGDTDDRVVPGHSFKYIAALQAADTGSKPKLIRIDTSAGHRTGKPTAKIIEEYADMLAFIARWTGMQLGGEQ
jgi:prolyl oligopeptidase